MKWFGSSLKQFGTKEVQVQKWDYAHLEAYFRLTPEVNNLKSQHQKELPCLKKKPSKFSYSRRSFSWETKPLTLKNGEGQSAVRRLSASTLRVHLDHLNIFKSHQTLQRWSSHIIRESPQNLKLIGIQTKKTQASKDGPEVAFQRRQPASTCRAHLTYLEVFKNCKTWWAWSSPIKEYA